jgi:hypothetical protein
LARPEWRGTVDLSDAGRPRLAARGGASTAMLRAIESPFFGRWAAPRGSPLAFGDQDDR